MQPFDFFHSTLLSLILIQSCVKPKLLLIGCCKDQGNQGFLKQLHLNSAQDKTPLVFADWYLTHLCSLCRLSPFEKWLRDGMVVALRPLLLIIPPPFMLLYYAAVAYTHIIKVTYRCSIGRELAGRWGAGGGHLCSKVIKKVVKNIAKVNKKLAKY